MQVNPLCSYILCRSFALRHANFVLKYNSIPRADFQSNHKKKCILYREQTYIISFDLLCLINWTCKIKIGNIIKSGIIFAHVTFYILCYTSMLSHIRIQKSLFSKVHVTCSWLRIVTFLLPFITIFRCIITPINCIVYNLHSVEFV